MRRLSWIAAIALAQSALADDRALNAKCKLTIDGVIHLDGRCHFASHRGFDEFDDLRMRIVCPGGQPPEVAMCAGAEEIVVQKGVFGSLQRDGATAALCWNGGQFRKAGPCYQGLTRTGACWSSPRAVETWTPGEPGPLHHVELCAWAR
ncbi:MAG: hypothetical protein RLZZ383_3022 [Pseudomonadota bacterium]|jgi:hypothetical protein